VSLWFGRNEEGGSAVRSRWKYDVTASASIFPRSRRNRHAEKHQANSYPAIELAGVIWPTRPADKKPQEPAYDWTLAPPGIAISPSGSRSQLPARRWKAP